MTCQELIDLESLFEVYLKTAWLCGFRFEGKMLLGKIAECHHDNGGQDF